MRIIAVVVASLALAGVVHAQEQMGAWEEIPGGNLVYTLSDKLDLVFPAAPQLSVGCFFDDIQAKLRYLLYAFPSGTSGLTWDDREEVPYIFEPLGDFPNSLQLQTRDLSFIEDLLAHNRLTVKTEVVRDGQQSQLDISFDLRGSQAALRTLRCWPWPDRPALSNPPAGALERARQKCRETFSDDFVLQNACIEQQEEAYRNRR